MKILHKIQNILQNEGIRGLANAINRKALACCPPILKSTSASLPSLIMIEITNLCNLRCITCPREYSYGQKMKKGMMEYSKFTKLIDDVSPFIKLFYLTGLGEPLLYKNLPQALDYIHAHNPEAHVFISTNVSLSNSVDIIKTIHQKIDVIQISIDGVSDMYNSIRQNADYDSFIKNVKHISEIARDKLVFNMVVFKENYHEMVKIIELAHDLGISRVNFNPINYVSMPHVNSAEYALFSSEQYINEYNNAVRRALELNVNMSAFGFSTLPGFRKCEFPWDKFYITWDGYLVPCCAKPFPLELNFGNVFECGLMNCVNSRKFREFRRLWHRNKTPLFCNKCHFIEIPAIKLASTDK